MWKIIIGTIFAIFIGLIGFAIIADGLLLNTETVFQQVIQYISILIGTILFSTSIISFNILSLNEDILKLSSKFHKTEESQ